jgi:hypothetical protein
VQLAGSERERLLGDPGPSGILFALRIFAAQPQREGLLHPIHPDAFENNSNGDHKSDIVAAFSHRVLDPSADIDRKLAEVRSGLDSELGQEVNIYVSPL